MAPEALIRPYAARDLKLVKFMVGKANLQSLAVANNKSTWSFVCQRPALKKMSLAYIHPITLALWFALSSAFMQAMSWWPTGEHGLLGYLRPFPAFAAVAVPLMFFVDWCVQT